jgi:two-component system phosphate regulon sensor histidine kinase PhoR
VKIVQSGAPFDVLSHLTNDGLALVDSDGVILEWNDAAARTTAIPRKRAVGANIRDLFIDGERLLESKAGEIFRVASADPHRSRAIRSTSVSTEDGRLISFASQRRYDEIEQLKNEIIAAVSHELKTPVATIKAYAMTLRENPDVLEKDRHEYLRMIDEQSDRLSRAVDDLLDAARVDPDHLLKSRECTSLDHLIDEAMHRVVDRAHTHTIERVVDHVHLYGDPELLRNALGHIIDNAIKFSPNDDPIVIEGYSREGQTIVRIRDRGIGIAPDHLPYIFERFYRVESSMQARVGGAGLGLSIAQSLIQAHRGQLTVESAPGEGSVFTIMLPERL